MSSTSDFDVIVVGSGAAGGAAACELVANGLRVCVLEAGRRPTEAENTPRYWEMLSTDADTYHDPALAERQPIQRRHGGCSPKAHHFFVDDLADPYVSETPVPFTWIRGKQLGGRTLVWGGQTWRLSDQELRPRVPPGLEVASWPLTYADLCDYYDEVEAKLGAVGGDEDYPHLPRGVLRTPNPLTASEEYLRRNTTLPVVRTRAIGPENGASAWPRFSSRTMLDEAAATGRCHVITDATAHRIVTGPDGRAREVLWVHTRTGEARTVSAKAIVLAASTIESLRVLLASAPGGLANSSGLLGHYLADHCGSGTIFEVPERFEEANPPEYWNGDGLYLPRPSATDAYYGGFGVMVHIGRGGLDRWLRAIDPNGIVAKIPRGRVGSCVVIGEVLPRYESRVRLHPTRVDSTGLSVADIRLEYTENEARLLHDASRIVRSVVDMMEGTTRFEGRIPPGLLVHEVGGARMGGSPKDSVVDSRCRTWDIPNLLVVDGACWPNAAYQNPTLTIMAIAKRAARLLSADLRTSSPP